MNIAQHRDLLDQTLLTTEPVLRIMQCPLWISAACESRYDLHGSDLLGWTWLLSLEFEPTTPICRAPSRHVLVQGRRQYLELTARFQGRCPMSAAEPQGYDYGAVTRSAVSWHDFEDLKRVIGFTDRDQRLLLQSRRLGRIPYCCRLHFGVEATLRATTGRVEMVGDPGFEPGSHDPEICSGFVHPDQSA